MCNRRYYVLSIHRFQGPIFHYAVILVLQTLLISAAKDYLRMLIQTLVIVKTNFFLSYWIMLAILYLVGEYFDLYMSNFIKTIKKIGSPHPMRKNGKYEQWLSKPISKCCLFQLWIFWPVHFKFYGGKMKEISFYVKGHKHHRLSKLISFYLMENH